MQIINFEAHAQRRRAGLAMAEMAAPRLTDLIPRYEHYLIGEKRSKAGRERYLWAFGRLIAWLEQGLGRPPIMADLTHASVRHYKEDLGQRCENATIINALAQIRDFSLWAKAEGWRDDDPTEGIKRPPKKRPDPDPLYPEEIEALIRVMDEPPGLIGRAAWYWRRNRLCILLFLYTGMRLSEIAGLRWERVKLVADIIEVKGDAGAKNGDDRRIPTHARLQTELLAVPACYRKPHMAVIPKAKSGKNLTDSGVAHIFEGWLKDRLDDLLADDSIHIHPHRLRHTLASLLVWNGENLKVVQEVLGHKNLSTTEFYIRVDDRQKRAAMDRLPDFTT